MTERDIVKIQDRSKVEEQKEMGILSYDSVQIFLKY